MGGYRAWHSGDHRSGRWPVHNRIWLNAPAAGRSRILAHKPGLAAAGFFGSLDRKTDAGPAGFFAPWLAHHRLPFFLIRRNRTFCDRVDLADYRIYWLARAKYNF